MVIPSLPQDILLLLCEELAFRRDFNTLFRTSLVSRRFAALALEQLYGIQEHSLQSSGESGKLTWARLWRSIILSSIGKTAYPYCAYIRDLSLGGSFQECMADMLYDRETRDFFFSGPMASFYYPDESWMPPQNTRRAPLPRLDTDATTTLCGDSVIDYISTVASDTQKAVALERLEAYHVPTLQLVQWVSCLGTLTTLQLRDGSVLGHQVGAAIAESCPRFTHLSLYYCHGPSVDEDLAAFFLALPPDSLQSFQVLSKNIIGRHSLGALNARHAASLRALKLGSLSAVGVKSLGALPGCTSLAVLEIDNEYGEQVDVDRAELRAVADWIGRCAGLRHLGLRGVQNSFAILRDALASPRVRLASLSIQFLRGIDDDGCAEAWAALGRQDRLESFTLGARLQGQEPLIVSLYPALVDSLCRLRALRYLNLTQVYVQGDEIARIAASLPDLRELAFGGEVIDDSVLECIADGLPRLTSLAIHALSVFSHAGLLRFAARLAARPADLRPWGFQFDIMNQMGTSKIDDQARAELQGLYARDLGGRFDIIHWQDPDEEHESDFSDSE